MKRLIMVSLAAACLFAGSARADDGFRPSRVRLLLQSERELSEKAALRLTFMPSPNLIGPVAPHIYLGVGFKAAPWIDLQPTVGWDYLNDEPIMAINVAASSGKWSVWADDEFQLPSQSEYWFVNVDFQALGWLAFGLEGEGWAVLKDRSSWSNGVGPNLLFTVAKSQLDLALHGREEAGSFKPEFVLRIHYMF